MITPACQCPVPSSTGRWTKSSTASATKPADHCRSAKSQRASREPEPLSSRRKVSASAGLRNRPPGRGAGSQVAAELGHAVRKLSLIRVITSIAAGDSPNPWSAYPMAKPRTSSGPIVPWSRSRVSQAGVAPGTVAASKPVPGTNARPACR